MVFMEIYVKLYVKYNKIQIP